MHFQIKQKTPVSVKIQRRELDSRVATLIAIIVYNYSLSIVLYRTQTLNSSLNAQEVDGLLSILVHTKH